MVGTELDELLRRNGLSRERLEDRVYRAVILSVFERVVQWLDAGGNRLVFLAELRKARHPMSELAVYRTLISRVARLDLDDNAIGWIKTLLEAHRRRSDTRKPVDCVTRSAIVTRQGNHCAICGRPIAVRDSHLDHIVPFKLVGDELPDNLQALCQGCNSRKSSSLYMLQEEILACRTGGL